MTSTPSTSMRAVGRREQADQHADRRALAGAVGAEEREDRARRDLEAEIVDGREVAEALGEPGRADDRRRSCVSSCRARARASVASMSTGTCSTKWTPARPASARRTSPAPGGARRGHLDAGEVAARVGLGDPRQRARRGARSRRRRRPRRGRARRRRGACSSARRAGRDDAAVVEIDEPVARRHFVEVARADQDQRVAPAAREDVPDLAARDDVDARRSARRGRAGPARGGARSRSRASASCRPRARRRRGRRRARGRCARAAASARRVELAAGQAMQAGREAQVLQDREVAVQAERLRDVAEPLLQRRGRRRVRS